MNVPLMNLINNQNVVPREGGVRAELAQKQTLRGSLDYAQATCGTYHTQQHMMTSFLTPTSAIKKHTIMCS